MATQKIRMTEKARTAMKTMKAMKKMKPIATKATKTVKTLKPMKSMKIVSRITSETQSRKKRNVTGAELHSNTVIQCMGSVTGVELRKELQRAGGLVVTGMSG